MSPNRAMADARVAPTAAGDGEREGERSGAASGPPPPQGPGTETGTGTGTGPGPGQGLPPLQQHQSAPPTTTATAATTAPSRTVSFRNLHHHRRQSQSERISEILENARSRAESMSPEPGPATRQQSSGTPQQQQSGDEVSADELTGFMSRGSAHSYRTVQRVGTSRSKPRSIYDHPSQAPVDEDDGGPPTRRSTRRGSRGSTTGPAERNGRSIKGDGRYDTPWWRKPLGNFQSIELENKGSVARDHLALERTFLAWLRTSLAFASIGIAVTQLFRLNTSLSDTGSDIGSSTLRHLGKPLGATFLAISILTLLLGFRRYFHGQDWVIKGKFPASRGTIIIVAFVALAIMIVSLVVVIVIHPTEDMDL
ncbi:DNA-binding protein SMUBP-2 [Purpureocillium lavendulum]|uniref:DNA-binding protein SMUBP-2 n=1 Tax=Purpureocillium lavendulum TaxID=1247861 RepID=A0AB34G4C5_9HYPO|nr:DNA-binding protein SMUBP-2 [Purpureocillium lavendulum]